MAGISLRERTASAASAEAVWALAAYPVSAGYLTRLEERIGAPVSVSLLSELRTAGLRQILRTLVGIRRPLGLVLMEDELSAPIVPILRCFISLTRCEQLALADPEGRLVPFTRMSGLTESVRLAAGSMFGLIATLRCAVELAWIARRAPVRPPLRPIARVAYLKTNIWFGVRAGGSVGHVAGVANALARRCESVDLLAVERPALLQGVHHHQVPNAGVFGYPYELNYYRYQHIFARHARKVFARRPADIIYQRLSLADYSGLRLARDLRVPLVIEFNGSEVWVSKHWGRSLLLPGLAARAEDLSLQHADLIVTVSDVLGRQLVDKGIAPERILVHPNCVDPAQFDPARFTAGDRAELLSRYGIPPRSIVCGFIGTFGAWHGVTVLAEAIRRLALVDPAWLRRHQVHFLVVGDGVFMPKVRETLADDRIAPFFTLTGLVPQDAAPRYLAASDILLSPHVRNADGTPFFGSPTKLFEYMAMAKGIVASDLEQIGEVLRRSYRAGALPGAACDPDDPHLAVLIEPGSIEQLAEGIRFLVERPDYREILGRNARQEVLARYT